MAKAAAVWVLHGARTGDNAQATQIAVQLGVPFAVKPLVFNWLHHLPNWALGGSLTCLDRTTRAGLGPSWPRLVIAAGKRSVPVARFIRQQSGGHSRLVHVGRPRARLDLFDLVITTPQYGLPPLANVVELALPFAVPKPVSDEELGHWRKMWQESPRPWIAVTVGAAKFPQRFDLRVADDLAANLSRLNGTLLIIASPRTDGRVMELLGTRLGNGARLYPWGGPNPHQAALQLVDRFVVTSDSLSMLSEAMATGKPVNLFRLPQSPLAVNWQAKSGFAAFLARQGLVQPPRNMGAVVDALLDRGHATPLGEDSLAKVAPQVAYGEAIAKIRDLL